MDFHIDFIQSKYSLNAEELRCLSKALGYPKSALNSIFNLSLNGSIQVKEMISLMEKSEFNIEMNQNFNIYPSKWNQHLIITAILLLGQKSISFKDLNLCRCVFHFYEQDDGKGVIIDKIQLLHYFKMCGRLIAPMKLVHRLKHMKHRLYIPGRLQLWEFLELIMWSDVLVFIAEHAKQPSSYNYDENKNNEFSEKFENNFSIIYGDINAWENENIRYIKEEWIFPKGNFKKTLRLIYKSTKPNPNFESRQEVINKCNILKKQIVQSNYNVIVGYGTGFRYNSRKSLKIPVEKDDKEDLQNMIIKENSNKVRNTKFPQRPKTAPIVTLKEIENSKHLIEECHNYIKKLPEKYKERIKLDMEYLKPGFWSRWENRPPKYYSQLTDVNLDVRRIPSKDYIERLSKSASKSSSKFHEICFE